MQSLPLFHQVAGQPVLVLGDGDAAEAKRRLVLRAGARVVTDIQQAVDEGARLAFVAHDDPDRAAEDALRLRCAGLLVNVTDRPELCDFTVPSVLDRDPVLVAVGTGGASAGLAKHLRMRLERLIPASLGTLAAALYASRTELRRVFPQGADRRNALDTALAEGGPLDVMTEGGADRVTAWLAEPATAPVAAVHEFALTSDDPEDLTLRQARLLAVADAVIADAGVGPAILARARADALRLAWPHRGDLPGDTVVVLRRVPPTD